MTMSLRMEMLTKIDVLDEEVDDDMNNPVGKNHQKELMNESSILKGMKKLIYCEKKLKKTITDLSKKDINHLCISYIKKHLNKRKPGVNNKKEVLIKAILDAYNGECLKMKKNPGRTYSSEIQRDENEIDFSATASTSARVTFADKGIIKEELEKRNLKTLFRLTGKFVKESQPRKGSTKAKLVKVLLEANITLDQIKDEEVSLQSFNQLLHESWFMRPLEKPHFRIGLENEARIIQWLEEHLMEHNIELIRVVTFGLTGLKSEDHITTSIDALLVIRESHHTDPDGESPIELVIGEFKTRTSTESINKLESIKYRNEQKNFWKIDVNQESEKFKSIVHDRSYRTQVVHHACATGLDKVLYVEATKEKIVFSALLNVDEKLKTNFFISILDPIHRTFVKPILESLKDGESGKKRESIFEMLGVNPKYAVDEHTYRQAYYFRGKLIARAKSIEGCYPPARAIIPAVVDFWNNQKGGVDVVTRLVDNINPKHAKLNLIARIYLRSLCTMLMNAHLASRLLKLKAELGGNKKIKDKYETYDQFKARLNSIGSFSDFLFDALKNFNTWMKRKELDSYATNDIPVLTNNPEKGTIPSDVIPSAVIPTDVNYENKALFSKAPKKNYQRDLWNKGEQALYRKHKKQSKHSMTSMKEARCIVCCETCDKVKPGEEVGEHTRLGSKTVRGCFQCAESLDKKRRLNARVRGSPEKDLPHIALCKVKRFNGQSCFDIHHSKADYPELPCCKNEVPRGPGDNYFTTDNGKRRKTL